MHQPPWSLEDAAQARELSRASKEKLKGLCYRVRKSLGRHENDLADGGHLRAGQKHIVLFHAEGIPESLDRLRVEGAAFKLNLSSGRSNEIIVNPSVPDVSLRSTGGRGGKRQRLRPHLARGMQRMPRRVFVNFWFEVAEGWTAGSKFVPLFLYMSANEDPRQCNMGAWEVPSYAAYAASASFMHGIDAEAECIDYAEEVTQPKRWWNEKEHCRQAAEEPLNPHVVQPREGPYAEHIEQGGVLLNLEKCSTMSMPPLIHPWRARGVRFASAVALWAFLGNDEPAASGALNSVRRCVELGQRIALFLLEPDTFEFTADVFYSLALACM